MKTKLPYIVLAGLIGIITYLKIQNYSHKSEIETLEKTVFDMRENAKAEKKQIRDSAQTAIDTLTATSQRNIKEILKRNQKIKYIPYEKYIYSDRTVDSAIDTLAEYSYQRSKKKN